MKLELNGIEVDCIIGERADERTRPQRLRVEVALEIADLAADTDELSDTVDYAALTEAVRKALVKAQCKMIERAAKVVAETCLAHDQVRKATAKVIKSGAVAHLESAAATWSASK